MRSFHPRVTLFTPAARLMETVLQLPESEDPCTIKDVVEALRKEKLFPSHESKNWGDWIHFEGERTVISIESLRGLTSSATIEHSEDESEELTPAILRAFGRLKWVGIGEDGEYPLD
jgi:hypothetical protein